MADNQKGIPFNTEDEGKDIPSLAKKIIYDTAVQLGVLKDHPTFSIDEVYVDTYIKTHNKQVVLVDRDGD